MPLPDDTSLPDQCSYFGDVQSAWHDFTWPIHLQRRSDYTPIPVRTVLCDTPLSQRLAPQARARAGGSGDARQHPIDGGEQVSIRFCRGSRRPHYLSRAIRRLTLCILESKWLSGSCRGAFHVWDIINGFPLKCPHILRLPRQFPMSHPSSGSP